jgi:hypothetical protein
VLQLSFLLIGYLGGASSILELNPIGYEYFQSKIGAAWVGLKDDEGGFDERVPEALHASLLDDELEAERVGHD